MYRATCDLGEEGGRDGGKDQRGGGEEEKETETDRERERGTYT